MLCVLGCRDGRGLGFSQLKRDPQALFRCRSMAFVLRASVDGKLSSWCTSRISRDSGFALVPMLGSPETVLLAAVSEFGDLGSYLGLSQVCRDVYLQLAASMLVVRNHARCYFVMPPPLGVCWCCSGYGLGECRGVECDSCGEAVCEDCVVLVAFGGNPLHSTSWTCLRCDEGLDTVVSLRSWLMYLVDDRMLCVYNDYNFDFWLQLVTLSGEKVRDAQDRPSASLVTSWDLSFDLVWSAVYHGTGGRIRQMAFGDIVVDDTNKSRFRWSHLLTRLVAREHGQQSPLRVMVLLRGWF